MFLNFVIIVLPSHGLIRACTQFVTLQPLAHQAPLSMGFFDDFLQARVLEWFAISSSGGSSRPRDWTSISCVSCIARQILHRWAIRGASASHGAPFMMSHVTIICAYVFSSQPQYPLSTWHREDR